MSILRGSKEFKIILVKLFNDILDYEESVLRASEFKDLTNNDIHVIRAIGMNEKKNMSMIAKELAVTIGTLTISINSLVRKGYVIKERSEKDKRVVFVNLSSKGEAAFYGPKLDVQVISALGHDITLSTCQLDYQLPEKFELEYVDENGDKVRPVVIHRAIFGSLDRVVAFLLEETKGNLPVWLAPVQVKVLPISDKFIDEAKKVYEACFNADLKVELDDRAEKIGYKIREAQTQKIPYMLIVGAKEVETNTVSIRKRSEGEIGSLSIEDTVAKIKQEIENKSL